MDLNWLFLAEFGDFWILDIQMFYEFLLGGATGAKEENKELS